MNIKTHIIMSNIIYDLVSDYVVLDRVSFNYGNFKPDLARKDSLLKPHVPENYMEVVEDMAKDLMENEYNLRDFSVKLGEICHYSSDFFCRYHQNEDVFKSYAKHLNHEVNLYLRLKYALKKNKLVLDKNMDLLDSDIGYLIEKLRFDYSYDKDTYLKDIVYAITASINICNSIAYYGVNANVFDSSQADLNIGLG